MTFPPDLDREPRRARAWALIGELTADGHPAALDELIAKVAAEADVQPKTVASLVSSAKRAGWAKFERRATPAEPWRVRTDFERCLVCGQPRGPERHAEPRSQESAVDASAADPFARLRAVGAQRWLNAMALVGLIAALQPIEPEELASAAHEFSELGGDDLRDALALLTDEFRLVELDVTSAKSKVYYVMVSDGTAAENAGDRGERRPDGGLR